MHRSIQRHPGGGLHHSRADIVWTNAAGGNWSTAANWSPNLVPGSTDIAYLTNSGDYTVTLNGNATVSGLMLGGDSGTQTLVNNASTLTLNSASTVNANGVFAMGGGTLNGTGTQTVFGLFSWSGGILSGAGQIIITNGAFLTLNGAGSKSLAFGRKLLNHGTMTWNGGQLTMGDAGTAITNFGIWNITHDGTLATSAGAPQFVNLGIIAKTGGTGVLEMGGPINNQALIQVQTGTWRQTYANGNGHANSGTYDLAAGATLELFRKPTAFSQTIHTWSAGATVSGTGTFILNDETLTIAPGATVPISVLMQFVKGTINGSGTLSVQESLDWQAGIMSDIGTTLITNGAALTLNSAGVKSVTNGRKLGNHGITTWNAGQLAIADFASAITNVSAWNITHDASISVPNGRFVNLGIVTKSAGAGTLTAGGLIDNRGTIAVQTGTWQHQDSNSANSFNSGLYDVAAGAALRITANIHTWTGAAAVSGAGTFTLSGGTLTVNTTVPISVPMFFTGGTINGSGTLLLQDSLDWQAGGMGPGGGAGVTVITNGAALTLNGAGVKSLTLARKLVNHGTMTWNEGQLTIADSGTAITNVGTWNITHDGTMPIPPGSPQIVNLGTIAKMGGTGILNLGTFITNRSLVDIQTGIIAANGGYGGATTATVSSGISGTNAGTGFGQLRVPSLTVNRGKFKAVVVNGFAPANARLAVVAALSGTLSGTFNAFEFDSDAFNMSLSYSNNAVFLDLAALPLLTLTPPTPNVANGASLLFTAGGGKSPYTFQVVSNQSGANVAANGLYTAGPACAGVDVVSVTDSRGSNAFAVVQTFDGTAPVLTCPDNILVEATSPSGSVVNFTLGATDNCDPEPLLTVSKTSGSGFPIGVTLVTGSGLDASGNSNSCSFTVTVQDTTPPALQFPVAVSVQTTNEAGTEVQFTVTATDVADHNVSRLHSALGRVLPCGHERGKLGGHRRRGKHEHRQFRGDGDIRPNRLRGERNGAAHADLFQPKLL